MDSMVDKSIGKIAKNRQDYCKNIKAMDIYKI